MIDGFDFWPPISRDLNPVECVWPHLKRRVYDCGDQIISMERLEAVIKDESSKINTRQNQGCHRSQWTHHPLLDAHTFFFNNK